MDQDAGEVWKVGELARSTGLTVRTLHHYDQVGLLQPSGRTVAGHRLYDAGDVQRLYQVVALRALGLSLDAVRAVLAGPPNVQTLLHEHLDRLDRQLIALRAVRRRVAAVVAGADAAGTPAAADLLDLIREVIMVDETVSSYVNARTPRARPDVLPQRGRRGRGTAGDARVRGGVRPVRAAARRLERRRRRRGLTGVRFGRRLDRPADHRRRAAPLRLERLLQRTRARRPPRRGRRAAAALPVAARSAQLERARLRHPTRPARAPAAQDHHPGRAGRQGRLLPPAHPALRAGRDLPVLPGRRERRGRTGRDRAARPRHVRRAAGLRDRPRTAVPGLRRLVAPQPEHAHHQRVGHPVHDRGRRRAGAAARQQVRPPAALLGPRRGRPPADHRPRRRPADGAGDPPGPRPGGRLGLRRGRGLHHGSVGVRVALAPRRRYRTGPPTR